MRIGEIIASVGIAVLLGGSAEYKEAEKKQLTFERDSAISVCSKLHKENEEWLDVNKRILEQVNELTLKNDSLEQIISTPKTEAKCPDCPKLPEKILVRSRSVAYYDPERKTTRQPIELVGGTMQLEDTAVDINRQHPHSKIGESK